MSFFFSPPHSLIYVIKFNASQRENSLGSSACRPPVSPLIKSWSLDLTLKWNKQFRNVYSFLLTVLHAVYWCTSGLSLVIVFGCVVFEQWLPSDFYWDCYGLNVNTLAVFTESWRGGDDLLSDKIKISTNSGDLLYLRLSSRWRQSQV